MATRVFELARALGVTSKAVLEKCRAEGIDLKNHMAALSAGLEATIVEWFSEGANATAVETAEPVDLEEQHRIAAQQRRRRHQEEGTEEVEAVEQEEGVETATAVAEAAPGQPEAATIEGAVAEAPPAPIGSVAAAPAEAPAPAVRPVEVVEVRPEAQPVAAAPAPPAAPEAPPTEAPEAEAPPAEAQAPLVGPRVIPNVPLRPKDVKPAGPQVVPAPAKLQGPRVVRFVGIEADIDSRRPPASSGGARPSFPSTAGGTKRPAGPAGEAGAGEEGGAKKAKRRSPRRKSGRSADTGEGLREWRDRDLLERSARLAAASGGTLRRHRATLGRGPGEAAPTVRGALVEVSEPITVKGFSAATGLKISQIIRFCMSHGTLITINSTLDRETAELLAAEGGIALKIKESHTAEQVMEAEFAGRKAGTTESRAPVVTFLGHVDHGKTSLLDRIRHATVAAGEEGGITQHVGSYRYEDGGRKVVFLDTPGHEAFTAMRARGANMTDVVVLVVAADDGVMPQTVEALSHAKAAKVPIVVALNKMDVPNANEQRVLGQLAEHGLNPREWGGQTEVIRTSAATGRGIDDLVEVLSLEAELLELKADPSLQASGWVIEAELNPGKGVSANLLIKDGTLHVGDVILCGTSYGRVRSITDDRGRPIEQAGPASPVTITGLDDMPAAGDRCFVVEDLNKAREVAEERRTRQREEALRAGGAPKATLENIFEQIEAGGASEVRLIVKADVQGSLEALLGSLSKLGNEEVSVSVLHSGVGGITEGDVVLAEASGAIILGFRVVADNRARAQAENRGIDVRTYMVIYELLEDVEKAVAGMLAPTYHEKVTGRAEVREVFKISRLGTVAGCLVMDGVIARNASVRIVRDNVVIEESRGLDSLKRFKDDVREVRAGLECGLKIAGFDDVKAGDVIEAYQMVEVPGKA